MIKPMEDLYELVLDIIENQCDNREFKEFLREKFLKKKLSGRIPNQILSKSLPLTQCLDIELICFAEACKEFFVLSETWAKYNKKDYFGEDILSEYETYNPVNIIPDVIKLENVSRDPDNLNSFIADFTDIKVITEWEKYRLSRYNFDTQREATKVTLRNGRRIKERTINEKSVEQISELFSKKTFKTNTITFNILITEGKRPNIEYNEEARTLLIKPNYNVDDIDFTPFDLIDGQHRVSGATRYVHKCHREGTTPQGRLHVAIMSLTLEEARNYIEVQARQNLMSQEFQESLKTNEHTKFIDHMISYGGKNKNILADKVSAMYDDMRDINAITYKTLLVDALKMTRIDVNYNIEQKFASEKFAEIITTLINFMKKEFYNNDLRLMKKENIFLTPNIFVGYIAMAEILWKDNDYINKLIDFAVVLQEDEVKKRLIKLKLNTKTVNKTGIFNYFKKLIEVLEE